MKPLNIDFLPPSKPPRWAWQALGALTLGLLAALLSLGWRLHELHQQEDRLTALIAQNKAAELARTSKSPRAAPQRPSPYDADARLALREARFATAEALTQMERVKVLGVMPQSIEMDAHAASVQVELSFKSNTALFEYLEALNSQEAGRASVRWRLLHARPASSERSEGTAVIFSSWDP